ncbi:hypothetical protein [Fibrobacter sp. UWB11]|uniref:hypothetical protein n=1 Tax=Fibrobacter sp. UWB11 TaxID=1896202 RepID=UPI00092AE084|nr:hypothetical protein [Fibrobacter sp. UWB11]SIN83656.1 hypothetical protein SAMN05720758_0159 [Fibrobacter sp. UWB11]
MRKSNKLVALAIGACSFLMGCTDSNPTIGQPADTPTTPTFSAFSCQEVTDASVAAQLESAKSSIKDVLEELGDNNLKNAQAISAQTKSTFKSVLDKYPANCEAQLGYALSIITDLMNNTKIKSFIDTVTNKVNIADMGVEDFNQLLIAGDGKHLTTMGQEAMASAIPSLDSAIIYLKNIVGDDNFVCHYKIGNRELELDRGEFAPALATMFVAKAVLTFGASLNIDISSNGKYDWMTDADKYNGDTKVFADYVISLMDKGSSFTTVYDNWKPRYRDIPNLLDSAIQFVEVGLQYGIDESKNGIKTQLNDPYIVGDDEMSDVSARDFQKAIDSLEHYRKALHTGVEITLPAGSKITVNIAKFFEITDGWQDYLPYHKFNDYSVWNIPAEGFYWAPQLWGGDTYAEFEINKAVRAQIEKSTKVDYFYGDLYTRGYSAGTAEYCADAEFNDHYVYQCFFAKATNCTVTFEATDNYYHGNDDISILKTLAPVTLNSSVCKIQDGVQVFAIPYDEYIPNVFYFTDPAGNKTISIQGLLNGKVSDEIIANAIETNRKAKFYNYTLDEMQNFIFFPDITVGGVFPGMTQEKFWQIFKTESRSSGIDW